MTVTAKPFISIYPGHCAKMTPSMQFLLIALFNVKEGAQPWRRMRLSVFNTLKIYITHAREDILSKGNIKRSIGLVSLRILVAPITRVR